MLDALPENRKIAIIDSLSHCSRAIAEKVNEFASDLIIKPCKRHISFAGKIEIDEPCFSPRDGAIYMDERVDDDEYAETFKHELGHFIDEQMGCPSCKEAFGFAIQADLEWFISSGTGIKTLGEMLGALSESKALENRYLSDILSAMFHGSQRQWNAITTMYDTLGVPIYGHEVSYWTGKAGPKRAAQSEIFADMFAIYAENDLETVRFTRKWFPNISNRFSYVFQGKST